MAYMLTAKSQVTLPKSIRDYLKVAPGDEVEFRVVADGSVRVEPVRPKPQAEEVEKAKARVEKLRGSLKSGRSTDEWMNLLRGYDDDDRDPGFADSPPRPGP